MSEQALISHSESDEGLPRRAGGARGQLSEQRAKWVRVFAKTGLAIYAAEQAGYTHPKTEASRLRNDPKVIKAVLQARQGFIEGDLGGRAYAELLHLMTDRERTPATVRFAACKWVLETSGHGGADMVPDSGKALSDMTLAELGAFILKGDQVLAGLQASTIQGTAQRLNSTTEQQLDLVTRLEVADLLG